MGIVSRILGVFTSPTKTFESIARKPGWDWLAPVALVMVAFFIAQSATVTKMDVDDAVKTQMKMMEKMAQGNLSEADRAKMETATRAEFEKAKSPAIRIRNCFFIFIPVLLAPLLYHAAAAAFGAKTKYLTVLSGYAYTQVIQVIPALLTAVVAWPRTTIDTADIQFARVLKSNVGAFLDFDTTNKAILAIASSIDIFDIWLFIVGSIALSKTTRFSPGAARMVVGGVWGLYILLKVIAGLAYSAMMG
jgi:hypothetical protein